MNHLTYRELKAALETLSEENLDDDVTVYLSHEDEYYGISQTGTSEEDDVLDKGHFFLATAKMPPFLTEESNDN